MAVQCLVSFVLKTGWQASETTLKAEATHVRFYENLPRFKSQQTAVGDCSRLLSLQLQIKCLKRKKKNKLIKLTVKIIYRPFRCGCTRQVRKKEKWESFIEESAKAHSGRGPLTPLWPFPCILSAWGSREKVLPPWKYPTRDFVKRPQRGQSSFPRARGGSALWGGGVAWAATRYRGGFKRRRPPTFSHEWPVWRIQSRWSGKTAKSAFNCIFDMLKNEWR